MIYCNINQAALIIIYGDIGSHGCVGLQRRDGQAILSNSVSF